MKNAYTTIILLMFSLSHCQVKLDKFEREVLKSEILKREENNGRLQKMIGDSLLVHINILQFDSSFNELKAKIIISGELSKDEVEKIFDSDPDKIYKVSKRFKEWTQKDFTGRNVTIFKGNSENSKRKILEMYNVLSISVPVVRSDKKFAFIQTSNEHEGGILHIYMRNGDNWIWYKDIQLYFI